VAVAVVLVEARGHHKVITYVIKANTPGTLVISQDEVSHARNTTLLVGSIVHGLGTTRVSYPPMVTPYQLTGHEDYIPARQPPCTSFLGKKYIHSESVTWYLIYA
jgi:hypothetical protein